MGRRHHTVPQEGAEPDAAAQPPLLRRRPTPEELWARLQPASAIAGLSSADAVAAAGVCSGDAAAAARDAHAGSEAKAGADDGSCSALSQQQLGMSVRSDFPDWAIVHPCGSPRLVFVGKHISSCKARCRDASGGANGEVHHSLWCRLGTSWRSCARLGQASPAHHSQARRPAGPQRQVPPAQRRLHPLLQCPAARPRPPVAAAAATATPAAAATGAAGVETSGGGLPQAVHGMTSSVAVAVEMGPSLRGASGTARRSTGASTNGQSSDVCSAARGPGTAVTDQSGPPYDNKGS